MKGRFDIFENDYVKFKSLKGEKVNYSVYYGKVTEISHTGHVGVKIDDNDKRLDFPKGLIIYIEKKQILQVYSPKMLEHLTPRLSLKHLWKNFIFREVKTAKVSNLLYVDYRYIGKTGFEKIKRFPTLEEAYKNVLPEFHKNIVPCYEEFFGFTRDKALRNNDVYYDKEIFFSKKCYTELDWSKNPTGDFLMNERGDNECPPIPDSVICGIVENGEKGLFFRKWFVCSQEFMTLWTMVCDPTDISLCESPSYSNHNWNKIDKKRKIKDFDKLLGELDTSFYSINLKLDIIDRRIKYNVHNLEKAALYYKNIYKKVAEILFSKGYIKNDLSESSYSEDYTTRYTSFQKRLVRNLIWAKNLKF